MDNVAPDLVNLLDTQADQTDVTNVHLRSTQEDTRMLEPDVVDRIHELSGQGLGKQTDLSTVGDLPQLRPPLSRWSHGRLSRTSCGAAPRRPHAQ